MAHGHYLAEAYALVPHTSEYCTWTMGDNAGSLDDFQELMGRIWHIGAEHVMVSRKEVEDCPRRRYLIDQCGHSER